MSGATIVMAPAMEHTSGMTRSNSTPELMALSSWQFNGQKPTSDSSFDVPSFDSELDLDMTLKINDITKSSPKPRSQKQTVAVAPAGDKEPLRRMRAGSLVDQSRRWFPSSKSAKESAADRPTTSSGDRSLELKRPGSSGRMMGKVEAGLSLSKRSWSFGPKRSATMEVVAETPPPLPTKVSEIPRGPELTLDPQIVSIQQLEPARPPARSFSRATSYFSKMKQKTLGNAADSDSSSATSAASASNAVNDTRFSQSTSCESSTRAASEEQTEMPHQNADSLWSSFKSMEIEFKTFTTNSIPKRMATVQGTLLPFLRTTANHPSTKKLSPEDVDRRAQILNLWWKEILEMLSGTSSVTVPGVERPPLFDILVLIMTRHEWRQTTSSFLPLAERELRGGQNRSPATEASDSNDSVDEATLLAETAEHNVRTMFVSNLVKQLTFVIDKLSTRNTPSTLLRFAGTTFAYASFFVSGVADILFRLLALSQELIRRTADALGLPRMSECMSDGIVDNFPPALQGLGWRSQQETWNFLRQTPAPPMIIARVPWAGQWMMRWKAKDTDLFFTFCKQFHLLSNEFLPADLPLNERAMSPGFVIVQARLLSAMDATVHRVSTMPCATQPGGMDGLGSDAAMSMPLSPTDMAKGMSENKLVVLLKSYLLENAAVSSSGKDTFADMYSRLFQASVRRTSLYNGPACFTLCDLMEEVFIVIDQFETQAKSDKHIDWDFWLEVYKKMLRSWNTVTEVRVFSSVYSLWDILAKNPARKSLFCLDWLLTEEVFSAFFNHWCPMVRAYYHRLLCWRICRCVGQADEVDTSIYFTVTRRLKKSLAHYLFLKQTAEAEGRFPPSSAPIVPTPGKRFMILRQELNQPQPGLFVNFDSFAKGPIVTDSSLNESVSAVDSALLKSDSKKKWSIFGKVFSMGAGSASTKTQSGTSEDELTTVRRNTAESRTRQPLPPKITIPSRTSESDSTCSSPLIDEQKYIFRFILSFQGPQPPARDRVLGLPRLPAPAQAITEPRSRSTSPHTLTAEIIPVSKSGSVSSKPNSVSTSETESLSCSEDESVSSAEENGETAKAEGEATHLAPADNVPEPKTEPTKPVGFYKQNAIYTGRALAEWAVVVMECNSFVLRRREEGIPTLKAVEIPTLGIDGFRRQGF